MNKNVEDLKQQNDINKIYRKFSDSTGRLISDVYYILCDGDSEIFKLSGDNSLYVLCNNLRSINSMPTRKVQTNIQKWNIICNKVLELLKSKFNINDINVLYELVRLHNDRNNFSHDDEKITKDELIYITKYSEQLWTLIENFNNS
jgi:hypothetical protein